MDEIKKKSIAGIYIRVSTEEQAREGFSLNISVQTINKIIHARWDIEKLSKDEIGFSSA